MFFGLFSAKDRGGPSSYIHAIAIPLILAGVSILAAPGLRDFFLHLVDKIFGTKLDFSQSTTTGYVLVGVGMAVYIIERAIGFSRDPLLALRHQSFLPIPPTLSDIGLPRRLANKRVQPIDCDLYPMMNASPRKIEAALSIQNDWAQKVVGAITGAPDAPVAYYGIVHIPFQFLAGCRFSSFRKIELFELERGKSRWRYLDLRSKAAKTQVSVERNGFSVQVDDVAIRISVSYLVAIGEVRKVLTGNFADVHLKVSKPTIDVVRSMEDVELIASTFRTEIDSEQVRGKRLHIFYSGPVSVGFSLGQKISPSIHGEVWVYNYDANSSPAYEWGIQMTVAPKEPNVRHF